MSRRLRQRQKAVYVWGALGNTEPPDDDDEPFDSEFDQGPDAGPDEHAADVAADRYHRDIDERASQ